MPNRYHSDLTGEDIHPAHSFVFKTEAERESCEASPRDVGRLAFQESDQSFWIFIAPGRWEQVGGRDEIAHLRGKLHDHADLKDIHFEERTDDELRDVYAPVLDAHKSDLIHHERYTDDEARRAVGMEGVAYSLEGRELTVDGRLELNHGDKYDVWIQSNGRTAVLGNREKATLHVNPEGAYRGGTVIGGPPVLPDIPNTDPKVPGKLWEDPDGLVRISNGKERGGGAHQRTIEAGQSAGTGSTQVIFGKRFPSDPHVMVTPWSNANVWLESVTWEYFTWGTDSGGVTVNWMAMSE